jgi:hypothetical protein
VAGDRITAEEYRRLAASQPPKAPSAPKGNSMFALGRLPPGTMNKTERRFLDEWIKPLIPTDVLWWSFEGIKLRLADKTFFTADFSVMAGDGGIDLIDVKGAEHLITEDARVKIKVAAERYPFRFFFAWPMGGTTARTRGWRLEQVGR